MQISPHSLPPSLRLPLELKDAICRDAGLRKKDLARLALTCRSWYIPANVILWESINGLGPLLALMPEGTWNGMEITTLEGSLYEDDPPLTVEHWTPVLRLSLLVKEIRLNDVTRTIQRRVMQYPPPTTLFPSLRSLTIDMWKASNELGPLNGLAAAHLIFLRAIIPQTLQTLTLVDAPKLFDILPLFSRLESLVIQAPHAALHVLNNGSHHGKALTSIVQCISCCGNLSWVRLDLPFGRRPELMEALARLSGLEHLRVWFCRPEQWHGRQPTYPDHAFPALRSLELRSLSFFDAAILLKSRQKRRMTNIEVFSDDPETPESLALFTAHVKQYCTPVTLRRIRLALNDPSSRWPISFAPIAPLMAFRNLRNVRFSLFCGVHITEAEWQLIGQSWPRLQSLTMRPRFFDDPSNAQPSCSLATLGTIARHCPELKTITLALDATVLPKIEALNVVKNRRMVITVTPPLQDIVAAEPVVQYLQGVFGHRVKVNLQLRSSELEAGVDREIRRRRLQWDMVSLWTSGTYLDSLGMPIRGQAYMAAKSIVQMNHYEAY
ncbi:uncharacterized protein SCHCODRAFT_02685390 [Schizophyllum commune H4-8]|nr:uncharacterized protein SCHCODRAFT_02685390 [Schizophyllum commune H4-8]KAI5896410.1 hypothetical protein SCHCODRAFT_02685390 [Schizophyllum commune H4-8]